MTSAVVRSYRNDCHSLTRIPPSEILRARITDMYRGRSVEGDLIMTCAPCNNCTYLVRTIGMHPVGVRGSAS